VRSDAIRAYPMPRKNRGPAGVDTIDESTPIPRTRVFPFYTDITANNRRTWSSPRIQGPALIKAIALNCSFGQSGSFTTFDLAASTSPITETAVALTTARPYTPLLELLDPFNTVPGVSGDGYALTPVGTALRHVEVPVELIVELTDFFLVMAISNNGAGAGSINGHVRVVEGVNRQALSFFL